LAISNCDSGDEGAEALRGTVASVHRCENLSLAVIGLGYVGLPLALAFAQSRAVLGFDIDHERVSRLRSGQDYSCAVSATELGAARRLTITNDPTALAKCNCYVVTVPTPLNAENQPDLSPLLAATETAGRMLGRGDIVIFESTVYPGVTEDICIPLLEQVSGLALTTDFHVGYSPERINPGDPAHQLADVVKLIAASSPEALDLIDQLYAEIVSAGTYRVESIRTAEAAKVIENTQRDVNIALVNEFAIIFERIGLDTEAVLRAAATKWNFIRFQPGLVGGHCVAVDPHYLAFKAAEAGYQPEIILAGRRVNDRMPAYVAGQMVKALQSRGISLRGSKILVLGLAFKENCADIRNSGVPSIVRELSSYGIELDVYDPLVARGMLDGSAGVRLVAEPETGRYDGLILAVAHDCFCALSSKTVRSFCRATNVIYDLKRVLPTGTATLQL
jgi:UDP-N-acetyl-D-galactosamine dehydrogenase